MRSARIVFGTLCFNWLLLVPFTYVLTQHFWPKVTLDELLTSLHKTGLIEYGIVYGFVSAIIFLILSALERSNSHAAPGVLKKA